MSKWIQKAVKHPCAFTAKAKRRGMSVAAFARKVNANPDEYDATTRRQASLARTLRRKKK